MLYSYIVLRDKRKLIAVSLGQSTFILKMDGMKIMKKKLFVLFCKKMKFMTFTFVVILIVAGINTQWNLTRVYVNDLKWEPVMEFGEDWYYYYHDVEKSMSEDGFLIYLRTKCASIDLQEFRMSHDPSFWVYDIDKYSYGDIFQVSESEIDHLREQFAQTERIIPLSSIIETETGLHSVLGSTRIIIMVFLWVITLIYGLIWFCVCLNKSEEMNRYLIWIKMSKKKIRNTFCHAPIGMVVAAWLASFVAFFPSYGDWEILIDGIDELCCHGNPYPGVEFVVAAVFFATGLFLYVCWWAIWNRTYNRFLFSIEKTDTHLFVSYLSIMDNLKLILVAQGFSEKAAVRNIKPLLDQRGVCAENMLHQFTGNEKFIFFEIQDILMDAYDEFD